MGKLRAKTSGFCFKISKARIRIRSPPLQSNPTYNSIKFSHKNEYYDDCSSSFTSGTPMSSDENSEKGEYKDGNRIMVVVDGSQEAKGALQWALSHTVQKEDTIVLLYIAKPSKRGPNSEGDINPKANGLLYTLKSICQTKRPGVQVEVVALSGLDKGQIIVNKAKEHRATLLVVGHRRRSIAWRVLMRWAGRSRSSQCVVDYCIQNAECMTIAVRRKSKKLGGYLITTKRHKNFWLLA
ncbi:hypothetical protein RND81_02G040000 [Saponaria officinalis]|uniref:UspA domain-containing protein n=1 Tax=Saponaria officinalis TaxID=3572 RepID=A0AAW1MPV3_SAPOF